ncbi:MAG: hypothetical protein ACP5MU_01730 [Thermoplasmata archaeon]
MNLLLVLSVLVLALSLLFLSISILLILRKYTAKGAILSIFFLIMSVNYLLIIYEEIQNQSVNLYIFVISDLLIVLSLLALTITR